MKVCQTVLVICVLVAAVSSKVTYDGFDAHWHPLRVDTEKRTKVLYPPEEDASEHRNCCGNKLCLLHYELWRINLNDARAIAGVNEIVELYNLDVWSTSKFYVDVSIRPEVVRNVRTRLAHQRLRWERIIPDFGVLIKSEEERLAARSSGFALDEYNTFEDIEGYLTNVAATNEYTTLRSIGKSIEGRDLWQLKISVGSGKPAVWIDCEIHAREWITGATCLFGIDYLLNSYGTDPDVTAVLDAYDFYIMPINNPDGYAYTWSHDRLWRKNRDRYSVDQCYGIDLNRNFDDHFGGMGTSPNSCSQTYRGPSPASEPETSATQDGIKDLISTANLKILFSIHSYSQLWMYPYGYCYSLPPEADEMDRVAQIGVDALTAVHGTHYVYGPIASTIYPAASTTVDYAYFQGIVHSYTLELRDTGFYGFLLPPRQITPTGEETWAGLIASILAV